MGAASHRFMVGDFGCRGEEQALHLADAVPHPIHLEQPEWYSLYDLEPDQTTEYSPCLRER